MLADRAVRLSLACSLAYLSPDAARSSEYAQRLSGSLQYAETVTVDELCASATILEGPDEGVVVAFRGSTAFRNYQSMFDLRFVPSELEAGGSGGKVHRGYQEASLRLYSKLAPVLADKSPERTVFVGHSYGGGTATMCALMHAATAPDLELVTFAGPRVGDRSFVRRFDSVLGASTTHIVHDLDPVLAQNQPLWSFLGFEHTGQIVRCSATEPRLLRDDEERGGLPLNFADHALYLGTFMGPRMR